MGKQCGGLTGKLKIELPYNLTIPLLDLYRKSIKSVCWWDECVPEFIAEPSTMAEIWNLPKCQSTGECSF